MEKKEKLSKLIDKIGYKKVLNREVKYKKLKGVDAIAWINLDRSENRKKYMEELLGNIDIPNYRISGVDGKTQNVRSMIGNCGYVRNLSNYEIACTLSHIKAISHLSTLPGKYFLVCEDDISLKNTNLFHEKLRDIIKESPEFDILLINKTYLGPVNENYGLWKNYQYQGATVCSTVSYIISKNGIKKLMNYGSYDINTNTFKINDKMDVADLFIYQNLNTYFYKYNFIATLIENNISTIHPDHLFLHEMSDKFQLKLILKDKFNIDI